MVRCMRSRVTSDASMLPQGPCLTSWDRVKPSSAHRLQNFVPQIHDTVCTDPRYGMSLLILMQSQPVRCQQCAHKHKAPRPELTLLNDAPRLQRSLHMCRWHLHACSPITPLFILAAAELHATTEGSLHVCQMLPHPTRQSFARQIQRGLRRLSGCLQLVLCCAAALKPGPRASRTTSCANRHGNRQHLANANGAVRKPVQRLLASSICTAAAQDAQGEG